MPNLSYNDLMVAIRGLCAQLEKASRHCPEPTRTNSETMIRYADALINETLTQLIDDIAPEQFTDEQHIARILTHRNLMWSIEDDPNFPGTTSLLIRTMNVTDQGLDPGGAELVFDTYGRLCRVHSWKAAFPPVGFFARLRWAWRWRIQIIPEEKS